MDFCPRCLKNTALCVCDEVKSLANRTHVLILRHPQEPDKELGTASVVHAILSASTLKTALSVPNLSKALGFPAEPREWIVLFLGSKYKFRDLSAADAAVAQTPNADQSVEAGAVARAATAPASAAGVTNAPATAPAIAVGERKSRLYFFDRNGQEKVRPISGIKGLVVLDGTWAQAKALWWRNPWLLKLGRAVLMPAQKSLYGSLRREPRRESLSTIESVAFTLDVLGEDPELSKELLRGFSLLLSKYKSLKRGSMPV